MHIERAAFLADGANGMRVQKKLPFFAVLSELMGSLFADALHTIKLSGSGRFSFKALAGLRYAELRFEIFTQDE